MINNKKTQMVMCSTCVKGFVICQFKTNKMYYYVGNLLSTVNYKLSTKL